MFEPSVEGERVLLRPPREADRAALIQVAQRSEAWLRPWSPLPPDGEEAYGAVFFDRVMAGASTETARRFLVVRRADEAVAGLVAITQISRGVFQSCCVGYWMGEAFANQGLMTEALRLSLGVIFDELALHRVEANIMPNNLPSLRLVQRLGFRREGLSRRYLRIAGVWEDHERWAMTVEDWRGDGLS